MRRALQTPIMANIAVSCACTVDVTTSTCKSFWEYVNGEWNGRAERRGEERDSFLFFYPRLHCVALLCSAWKRPLSFHFIIFIQHHCILLFPMPCHPDMSVVHTRSRKNEPLSLLPHYFLHHTNLCFLTFLFWQKFIFSSSSVNISFFISIYTYIAV